MIGALGFQLELLIAGVAHTANGRVPIRFGRLRRVKICHAAVDDVAVRFLADDRIGKQNLLGLSFLNHFRATTDDNSNKLTMLAAGSVTQSMRLAGLNMIRGSAQWEREI